MAVLALGGCKSSSKQHGTASAERQMSRGSDWSPVAALDECHAAIAVASKAPASVDGATRLLIGCASLVREPACRAALREQLAARPTVHPRLAAQKCAELYCPQLSDATSLAACVGPLPNNVKDFGRPYALLRRSMLLHDFSGRDAQDAVEASASIDDYLSSIPSPELKPPPSSDTMKPAELTVFLDGAGRLRAEGKGVALKVGSLEELRRALPHSDGERDIWLSAAPGVDFQQVIAAMDVLHDLGYEHVSFGVAR
jgi:biopolymer transport protein ExbD